MQEALGIKLFTLRKEQGMMDIGADLQRAYDEGYEAGKRDAAPRWVRVEDGLPKERDYYFAFTSDCDAFVGEYIPSVDQWWNGDDLTVEVTHWMPIEPPREDA